MSDYETIEIPFIELGNRQALTGLQLMELPWLRDFVDRFPNCFEAIPYMDVLIYYPEGDAPK
jgi:hypothetical protein